MVPDPRTGAHHEHQFLRHRLRCPPARPLVRGHDRRRVRPQPDVQGWCRDGRAGGHDLRARQPAPAGRPDRCRPVAAARQRRRTEPGFAPSDRRHGRRREDQGVHRLVRRVRRPRPLRSVTPMDTWATRIQSARAERVAAMAAEEQTIRDADRARRASPGADEPAAHLRRLGARPAGCSPTRVDTCGVSAGRSPAVWDRVEHAMWARGWRTTHDRTDAWHLCRGNLPVVMVDFTAGLHEVSPAPGGDLNIRDPYALVGRVRAKYGDDGVDDLWLSLINGGRVYVGDRLDEQELAAHARSALDGTNAETRPAR